MRFTLACTAWTIAAACQVAASPADAGSLEIAPTTVTLRQDATASVLYVNNYGKSPVTVQIEPFDWDQVAGKDQLTPSDVLMSSPPIATIPPQGKQTVRLMLTPATGGSERSFRLLISELPDLMEHVDHSVQVLTQFSVPVFTAGAGADSGKITWDAVLDGDGLELTARNEAAHHVKLLGLVLVTRSGDSLAVTGGGLNYILAGSSRSWKVACAHCAAGDTVRIEGSDEASGNKLADLLVVRR